LGLFHNFPAFKPSSSSWMSVVIVVPKPRASLRTTSIEQDGGRLIRGIAVNISHHACGTTDPREVMRYALIVAD